MKQVLLLFVLFFWAVAASAQIPQSFNYQAVARDKDGKPITQGDVTVTARILRNGTEVYSEQTDHTTTSTGLFTLRVGEGDPTDFQQIDWSLGGYTLQVSVKGAVEVQTPAVPIVSVPYALVAKDVTNERQRLELNGNQLSITGAGGNTVTLASTGTALQAGAGIEVINNTIINKGDLNPNDDVLKTDQAGGDVSGTFTALSVDRIKGRPVASAAPQNGQVLKWNGTTWSPDNDLNTVGSGNTATAAPLLGDGSAGSPVRLAPGSASGQVLKWNGTTWVPAPDETGTGGGITYTAGTGITVTGNSPNFTINNIGDTNAADDLTTTTNFGGDVTGIYNNLQIGANAVGAAELANGAVTGAKIAQQGATSGQVLKWNGTTWAPQNDVGGASTTVAVTSPGLSITGNAATGYTLTNTGDTNAADDLTTATNFGGDVSGTFNNLQIGANAVGAAELANGAVTGAKIAQQGATNGQVLKWNGTTWAPQNDVGGASTTVAVTSPGLSITGNATTGYTLTNTGDTNAADDLTNTTNFGGDVSGTSNNLQISANAVGTNEIANGSITAADLAAGVIPTSLPPNGAAGNDLSGLYPNPTVARIQGQAVAPIVPTDGQVLRYSAANTRWEPATSAGASGWNLTGNSGTDPSTNFIGTTDGQPIVFKVNGEERMRLDSTGRLSLTNSVSGSTIVGNEAGEAMPTAIDNTFFGFQAGKSNTFGESNCFFGDRAGFSNTVGFFNTFFGSETGQANTMGAQNCFIGDRAGYSNTTGSGNTVVGANAGTVNDIGYENCFFGFDAGRSNTSGIYNCFFGKSAGEANTEGGFNSFYGLATGANNTTGNGNSFFGDQAGNHNTTASGNSFFGNWAGITNTTGEGNSYFGTFSGEKNLIGGYNSIFGQDAGKENQVDGQSYFGYNAGRSNTVGLSNCFFGFESGTSNVDGNYNSFLGWRSGGANTSGGFNSFFGNESGSNNTTGLQNSFFGNLSGQYNTTGVNNIFIGGNAGRFTNSGNDNSFMGFSAGDYNTSGNNNVCIGTYSNLSDSLFSNAIAVGHSAIATSSNTARIGNTSITSIGGQVGWSNLSDSRIKTNIAENVPGLAFIQRLRPVSYHLDIHRQNSLMGIVDTAMWEGKYDIEKMTFSGFLAQEVEQAARSIGYNFSGVDAPKNDQSLYGLRYAEFTVPLVKAVQEQQVLIEQQRGQLEQQGKLLSALQARLEVLEAAAKVGKGENR